MCLPRTSCVLYALFQDIFCFLDELSVKVYRVCRDATFSIVFAKDEFGGLSVVLLHLLAMMLPFFRERMRRCTVTSRICLLRSVES